MISVIEALERAEERIESIGDPGVEVASHEDLKYLLVGTDIDPEEFKTYVERTLQNFCEAMMNSQGDFGSTLNGIAVNALMVGIELGKQIGRQ